MGSSLNLQSQNLDTALKEHTIDFGSNSSRSCQNSAGELAAVIWPHASAVRSTPFLPLSPLGLASPPRDNVPILSRIIKPSNRILSAWFNVRVVTSHIKDINLSTSKASFEHDKHMEVKSFTCRIKLSGDDTFTSKLSKAANNGKGVQWIAAILTFGVSVRE